MNKNIFISFIVSIFGVLLANPPEWEDPSASFEFGATLTTIVLLDNGQLSDANDILAAFDDAGNIRGLGIALTPPQGPYAGSVLHEISVWSNTASGDVISFQFYDASEDEILDISESYTFGADQTIGDAGVPHELNIGESVTYSNSDLEGWWVGLVTFDGGFMDAQTIPMGGEFNLLGDFTDWSMSGILQTPPLGHLDVTETAITGFTILPYINFNNVQEIAA